ncbi:transcription factor 20-like isoform X2 [Myxocyprinus asiaticus]|uniref:transcription factor 20-like isoform X2 n=1 Tax=Myxocyprinus asiaticus TaxID=70543 RepID=UPI0022220BC6|nr:transcription factor 20-like isoform X2 [Myxocyprinus asiaticus]XP_051530385.1 transcription factor 20-like isoform X2 [Myxocyprinus asiaticus]
MEQPPSNTDLQPQDLSSTCSLPNVFDLSRNDEECLLKANPLGAFHVVQTPGWFVSPGTSNGMLLPENDSDPLPLTTDQIQPDNVFSNTTVTLSYVSRSHVFSNHNTLSEHPPIYSVPSLSKAFALHPAAYDASKLATDTGDDTALSVDMDQHCLQQVSVPVGLTACDQFGFMSPAQVVENVAALCYLQQSPGLSGLQDVESIALETLKSLQQSNPTDCRFPINMEELQNGAANGLWNVGPFEGGFPEGHATNAEGLHTNGNPEVVFLISRSDEPIILQNNQGPASFAISLNQDFISPLDPKPPPAASVDETEDVFSLPQAASSPSGENSFGVQTANITQEHLDKEDFDPATANVASEFITSPYEKPTGTTDNTEYMPVQVNGISEGKTEICKTTDNLCFSGSSLATKKTFDRKKLPPRTSRGMRLGAIVQNIYPTRYKSSRVSHIKKAQARNTSHAGSIQDTSSNNHYQHVLDRICTVEEAVESNEKEAAHFQGEEADVKISNRCKTTISTSRSKNKSVPEWSCDRKPTKSLDMLLNSTKRAKQLRQKASKKSSAGIGKLNSLPILKTSRKGCPSKLQRPTMGPKNSTATKKSHAPKRKRKKHKVGHTSLFSPQEPEIKLKYVNYKEEKRDMRDVTFAPYVRVELKDYPTCTVVNYPKESFRLKQGKQQASTGFMSGVVPATPCLQYGRVSMDGAQWGSLVCCLCGGSANAMDLGDLYGPYYPEGFKSASKTLTNPQEEEEDHSDSDSSISAKSGQCVASTPGTWTCKSLHKLSELAALMACQRWTSDSEQSSSSTAKRPRMDVATDWYSPPVVPLDSSEYWVHEDCGIWSAGVFLVRGKLYGLENAVILAKESFCSTCQRRGAMLGCVFKGCPNKYHYTCAVQSGCILNEDNFSMKCRKHKNKSIQVSSYHQITR